jgi:pseudouridine synthase
LNKKKFTSKSPARPSSGGERKPFGRKPSFGRSPNGGSKFGGNKSGSGNFGRSRFGSDKPSGDRPFKKSFGAKPTGDRPFRGKPSGDKPFRKSFGDKPSGDRPFRKSFGDKPSGERPFRKSFGDKPFGAKRPFSDSRRKPPFKSEGDRPRDEQRRETSYQGKNFRPDHNRENPPRKGGFRDGHQRESGGERPKFNADKSTRPTKPFDAKKPFVAKETPSRPRFEVYDSRLKNTDKEKAVKQKAEHLHADQLKKEQAAADKATADAPKVKVVEAKPVDAEAGIERLNKFMARSGVASRRAADAMIAEGQVSVNGEVIIEMGFKVNPTKDEVRVNGQIIQPEQNLIYIILNKPRDVITTNADERGRTAVLDVVKVKERVFPVGRLDRNTTGILLLTNDGELANKLMHPSSEITKEYIATLEEKMKFPDLEMLKAGVRLQDTGEKTQPCDAEVVRGGTGHDVWLSIHEGKNHQVYRMFESLGYTVTKLRRVAYAGLSAEDMERGQWRYLNHIEAEGLRQKAGLVN